LSLFRNHATKK
jgi:hypothetical protein